VTSRRCGSRRFQVDCQAGRSRVVVVVVEAPRGRLLVGTQAGRPGEARDSRTRWWARTDEVQVADVVAQDGRGSDAPVKTGKPLLCRVPEGVGVRRTLPYPFVGVLVVARTGP